MGGRRYRLLIALALAFLLAPGWLRAGGADARQRVEDAPLDLASAVLMPSDPGMGDYVVNGGRMYTLEEISATYGDSVEDLWNAGYRRQYLGHLVLPTANDSACAGQVIATWVYEYADEERAAYAVKESAQVMDEDGRELLDDGYRAGDGGVLYRDPAMECGPAGDEQGIRSIRQTADDCAQPKLGKVDDCATPAADTAAAGEGLHAIFRVGRLEVHVWMFDNTDPDAVPAEALPVTRDTIDDLTATVAFKAERVLGMEPGEGLEPMIVRVGDEQTAYPTSLDAYVRYEGEDFALTDDEGDARQARAGRFGDATDVYGMAQPYQLADGGDAVYRVSLYRFEDEATASDWLAGAQDRVEADAAYEEIEQVDDVAEVGAESYALAVTNTRTGQRELRVYVRVGADVAVVGLAGEQQAPSDVASDVATAQADAMAAGYSEATIPAPSW